MTGTEFMEKNNTGKRAALYKLLKQNYIQGGGNTAPINTETLYLQTEAEVEKVENP